LLPRWDNTRNGTAKARDAIKAMNDAYYDASIGRWAYEVAWWTSGIALTAILDYTWRTGSDEFLDQAKFVVEQQRKVLPWWTEGDGEFRADSTDDTGWVCLQYHMS
jgi:hypothetical protein